MDESLNTAQNTPLHQAIVRHSFLGVKYLFLDENTRIRYGFSFTGTTYSLQRKGIFWFSVAWTYPSSHEKNLKKIVNYLFWYEKDIKEAKDVCLF